VIDSATYDTLYTTLPNGKRGTASIRTHAPGGYRDTITAGIIYENISGFAISPSYQNDTLAGNEIAITARYGLTGSDLVGDSCLTDYSVLTDTTATATSLAKSKGTYLVRIYVGADSSAIMYYEYRIISNRGNGGALIVAPSLMIGVF
jgi:hypothetical protein